MANTVPFTEKAKLVRLGPNNSVVSETTVDFNPTSLVYTLDNSSGQAAGKPKAEQFAAQYSGKLAMELQFDQTDLGDDVRLTTKELAALMESSDKAARSKKGVSQQAQPAVSFQWGSYEFTGTMTSFKETIDFFSADGVPLRSLVSIVLTQLDKVFTKTESTVTGNSFSTVEGSLLDGTSLGTSVVPTGSNDSLTNLATKGGSPPAARQLGTDNNLESLRFTGGASLQVNTGIQFNAAAAFASSASPGVSLGATAGVASSASLQMSAGLGGGALFGGQTSAGVPASAGAFAGLETGRATTSSTALLDPSRMLRATTSTDVSTSPNASYTLGGAATGSVGFSSDVGANFNLSDALVFDGD